MKRFIFCVCICFSGCKVGPDYHAPETQMPATFTETKGEKNFAPTDEQLVAWWKCFEDPFLNKMLEEAVSTNFDYQIALEQVAQSRSQYWVEFASILPELDFDLQGSRFRSSQGFKSLKPASTTTTSTNSTTIPASPTAPASTTTTSSTSTTTGVKLSPVQSFFQIGFDAVWEIDLFGKLRRSADAAHDSYEAFVESSRDIKITVLSEIANTYTTLCASQEKVALQTDIVASDERIFAIASDRFAAGLSPLQDIESSRSVLEADKATLAAFQTNLKQNIYSLAVLLGKEPEKVLEDFLIKRPIPMVRGKVPAGLPAELLKRRHDIRFAERQLAAATEEVGVAVAQLYPTVSLTGSSSSYAANPLQGANCGFTSDKLNKLFKRKSRIWGVGGILTVPVFDFGKRLAGIDAQLSLQRQAALSYQKAVITALEEVEVAFATYFDEESREANFASAEAANRKNYELTLGLFETGLANASQLAQAKKTWLIATADLTDSRQALTNSLIALYKSLGGDW